MAAPRGRGLRPGGVVRALGRLVLLVCVGFALGLLFGLVTEEPELLASHLRGEGEPVELGERVDEAVGAENQEISDEELQIAAPLGGQVVVDDGQANRDRVLDVDPDRDRRPVDPDPTAMRSLGSDSNSPSEGYASAATRIRRLEAAGQEPASAQKLPAVAAARKHSVVAAVEVPEAARQAAQRGADWSIQVGAFTDQVAAQELARGLRDRYPVVVLPAKTKDGRWRVRVQPIPREDLAREMAERLKREERLPTWVTPAESGSGS